MINHEVKSQSSPPSPARFFLSQPNSWDSVSLCCSQLGQWWAPDPRGGLWQSESFPHEFEPIVMGPEPVNGKEILSRGWSWYCGRFKAAQKNLKTNFFFFARSCKSSCGERCRGMHERIQDPRYMDPQEMGGKPRLTHLVEMSRNPQISFCYISRDFIVFLSF